MRSRCYRLDSAHETLVSPVHDKPESSCLEGNGAHDLLSGKPYLHGAPYIILLACLLSRVSCLDYHVPSVVKVELCLSAGNVLLPNYFAEFESCFLLFD